MVKWIYYQKKGGILIKKSYFILNTNYKNNPEAHHDMLTKEKASAYFSPIKNRIKSIAKGDVVFLYKNGTGIVAMGVGTGIIKSAPYKGQEDEEFYTPLDKFTSLKTPLFAAKIKGIVGKNIVFTQTIFRIKEGDMIVNYVEGLGSW